MSDKNTARLRAYLQILKDELRPATGCTEPVAIALAAAKAREVLGVFPERLLVELSGSIIKNTKSVTVPHTAGLHGIPAAAAAGVIAGDPSKGLDVLSSITPGQTDSIKDCLHKIPIEVRCLSTSQVFDIEITAYAGEDSAFVRIAGHHTNVVCVKHNDSIIEEHCDEHTGDAAEDPRRLLTVRDIVEFADEVPLAEISPVLERQICCNMAVSEEGICRPYGANIGKTLLAGHENDLDCKMCAYAAAASDARMSGCEMPVIINSGSGNQGITCSVPVVIYAQEKGLSRDLMLRALCVSNLVTIRLKSEIGTLSAYCGAVCAGCGAASGIAYLKGGRYDMIAHTIVNTIAITSGMICDGAKASCAAKIASSVQAGLLGLSMYEHGNQFRDGDGIVKKGVENTISNMGKLAREGMYETNLEILQIMTES